MKGKNGSMYTALSGANPGFIAGVAGPIPEAALRFLGWLLFFALMALGIFMIPSQADAAPTEEQCSDAANLAGGALEWRQAGITEEVAMEFLRSQRVYSGLPVWAVKQAYDAPDDVPKWMLKGTVFGACREREE